MDESLMTMLRTAATYKMSRSLADAIVTAAEWQTRQAEALEVAIAEIERLREENAALKKAVATPAAG